MRKRLQVFVSSTYEDLKPERQAAVEEILRAGHIPAGMELFAAGDESQWEAICRWIDDSDVFMLILGGRYGSIEPKSGKSYVQMEYEYAASKGKPRFAVMIGNAALDRRRAQDAMRLTERDHVKEYEEFRNAVRARMCVFFDDQKDVRLAVHQSINDLLQRNEVAGGWVPVSEVVEPTRLVEEISRLTTENSALRKKLAAAEADTARTADAEADIGAVMKALRNMKIVVPKEHRAAETSEHVDMLSILYSVGEQFAAGNVTNSSSAGEFIHWLFFNVAPTLASLGLVERRNHKEGDRFYPTKLGSRLLSTLALSKAVSAEKAEAAKAPAPHASKPGEPKRSRAKK